ncbi:unnamed protein product [Linum trigynum]|uniref:Uncharacterized protein n=1 Tax=Linum trigynum TaxID=586398 RepID=A0AAV2G074_9ROSI
MDNTVRKQLWNVETLNENKLDDTVKRFLEDGILDAGGWPLLLPIYSITNVAVNPYNRILEKRHLEMKISF